MTYCFQLGAAPRGHPNMTYIFQLGATPGGHPNMTYLLQLCCFYALSLSRLPRELSQQWNEGAAETKPRHISGMSRTARPPRKTQVPRPLPPSLLLSWLPHKPNRTRPDAPKRQQPQKHKSQTEVKTQHWMGQANERLETKRKRV
jgi:hypothetical protein